MNVKYIVELSEDERTELLVLIRGGKPGARKMKRAQILLMAASGATDKEAARALHAGTSTVFRTRRRFDEGGLVHALSEASLSTVSLIEGVADHARLGRRSRRWGCASIGDSTSLRYASIWLWRVRATRAIPLAWCSSGRSSDWPSCAAARALMTSWSW